MTTISFPDNVKKVLFDMDGTLVDTEPIGPMVFEAYFSSLGVKVEPADLALFTKIWRREVTIYNQNDWLYDYARMNRLDKSKDQLLDGFYDSYIEALNHAKPLPGADRLLRQLAEKGVELGLVTASKLSQAQTILDNNQWGDLFKIIVTKDDQIKPKPSPEPYLLGLQKLGAGDQLVWVFEDARNGVISAKAAGCYVVGLRTGPGEQDLSQADVVIDDLSKVEFADEN